MSKKKHFEKQHETSVLLLIHLNKHILYLKIIFQHSLNPLTFGDTLKFLKIFDSFSLQSQLTNYVLVDTCFIRYLNKNNKINAQLLTSAGITGVTNCGTD